VRVPVERLGCGDVLIGVLSGKPWRTVRSVEAYTDGFGVHWVTIDATVFGGSEYRPMDIEVGVLVEIEDVGQ